MKELLKKIIYRHLYSSETYVKYLRKIGCKIGNGTVLFDPKTITIDETRPWLIDIGENVQITEGVTVLTHGYDWSVLKGVYGDVLGSSGKVVIGNNCFIGVNSTILKGTKIGNNVIIGANSLVNKDIPDNVVVAGNPAKIIMTLDEYYEKRVACQIEEAKELVCTYYEQFNKVPNKKILSEFFWLFEQRKDIIDEKKYDDMMILVNNYQYSKNKFLNTNAKFNSYEEFIEFCLDFEGEKKCRKSQK